MVNRGVGAKVLGHGPSKAPLQYPGQGSARDELAHNTKTGTLWHSLPFLLTCSCSRVVLLWAAATL